MCLQRLAPALQLQTDGFTFRSFYAEKPLHRAAFPTEAFTCRHLYTNTSFYTEVFTKRSFYTEKPLLRAAFTHGRFYARKASHTDAFTLYAEQLLHTEAFTQRSLCTARGEEYTAIEFTHTSFHEHKL